MDHSGRDPHGPEPDAPADDGLLAREQKLAAMREFRERTNFRFSPPGSLTSLYLKERRALRRVFPGTLADGVIKLRVLGEDGWEDVPGPPQPGS